MFWCPSRFVMLFTRPASSPNYLQMEVHTSDLPQNASSTTVRLRHFIKAWAFLFLLRQSQLIWAESFLMKIHQKQDDLALLPPFMLSGIVSQPGF